MAKVSWLNSTRFYSKVHLTTNGETTLCGYPFQKNFDKGAWVPYRVSKGRQGVCKECLSGLTKAQIKAHLSEWHLPENDIGWAHANHGAVHPDYPRTYVGG